MTIKEKFESIDQGKLKSEQVAFLQKIKTATKDFTLEDAVTNEKIGTALDKMISAFKESNPDAIKTKQEEKKEAPEQKAAPEKKATAKRTPAKRTGQTPAAKKAAEAKLAKEKEAEAKAEQEKAATEKKAEKKVKSEMEKLLQFVRRRKELKNISGTDIMRDARRQALPSGRRTSKEGNVYYEYDENRTDRTQGSKSGWYLENGGAFGAGHFAEGGELKSVVDAIFEYNEKRGKVNTSFGAKTKEGLSEMINNKEYTSEEITKSIFFSNEKKERVLTDWGSKSFFGLKEMIERARGEFSNGGAFGAGNFATGGKIKVGGDDFTFLLELSDKELGERLDLINKQKSINANQYFEAKDKKENTAKIEEAGIRLDNQWYAIVEARNRKNKNYSNGGAFGAGHFAEGGSIKNQYEGKSAEQVWGDWTEQQRFHFLHDHSDILDRDPNKSDSEYSTLNEKNKSFGKLTPFTKRVLEEHLRSGQYVNGGAFGAGHFADGGSVSEDISECKKLVSAFCKEFGDKFGLDEQKILDGVKFQDYLGYGASVFVSLRVESNITDLKVGETKPTGGNIIFTSDINPNGVTGKDDIARTYSIDIEIKGSKRFTQRRTAEGSYFKSYNYGRTIEEAMDKTDTKIIYDLYPLEKKDNLKFQMSFIFANGGAFGAGHFADGGDVSNERMYNFLKDDLGELEKAIEGGNTEEVDRFFSYWTGSYGHLKSLKTITNDRMYNFLKDDLAELEKAIKDDNSEEVDRFFSYWGQHLESLRMENGGAFGAGNFKEGGSLATMSYVEPTSKKGYYELSEKHGIFPSAGIVESDDDDDEDEDYTFIGRVSYLAKSSQDDSGIKGMSREYVVSEDEEEDAKEEIEKMFFEEMSNPPFNRKKYEVLEITFKNKKMAMGGFTQMDLAGHLGGGYDFGRPTYLNGFTGTQYTGLVGETGALSSGEMFENGGAFGAGHFAKGGVLKKRKFSLVEIPAYNSKNERNGSWYQIYDDKKNLQTMFLRKHLLSERLYSVTEVSDIMLAERILKDFQDGTHNENKIVEGSSSNYENGGAFGAGHFAKGGGLENNGYNLKDINGKKIKVGDTVKTTQPSGGLMSPSNSEIGIVEKTKDAFGNDALKIRYRKQGTNYDRFILLNGKINEIIDESGSNKKYVDQDDIESVTLKLNNKTVTLKGSDVLNGANLEKGGELSKIANYVKKADVLSVKLKNGETVKPLNGYWVKKGAEPINEKMQWQDAKMGDSARVKEINRMGLIVKAYGRKFHLQFPNGTEKTFDASELEFMDGGDKFSDGGAFGAGHFMAGGNIDAVMQDASQSYVNYYLGEGAAQGIYAKGGMLSANERYVLEMAGLTGLRKEAILNFISENGLTESEVLNIVIGIGRRQIKGTDVSTAVVGRKNNKYAKEVIAFAKSDKALKAEFGGSFGAYN